MKYDSLIIGAGLAGLTAAIRCVEAGLKTAVISAGDSALTFASGAIDVLGYHDDGRAVAQPFQALEQLEQSHPYSRVGRAGVEEALAFFCQQMSAAGLPMASRGKDNYWRATALGSLRPAWLHPPGLHPLAFDQPGQGIAQVAMVNIGSFRDFQPALAAAGLGQQPALRHSRTVSINLSAQELGLVEGNPFELRALDLARLYHCQQRFQRLVQALEQAVGAADLVVMPAVLETPQGYSRIPELCDRLGRTVMEVATLPPSLPGLRLARALQQRFTRLGGLLIEGDQVCRGYLEQGRVCHIETRQNPGLQLSCDHLVLATGRFFSRGLHSQRQQMREPIFGLDMQAPQERCQWSSDTFLDSRSQRFLTCGVCHDERLRPSIGGQTLENVYCAGAILAGFNPVAEGSAGGVAIATGFHAAQQIIDAQRSGGWKQNAIAY